MHDPDDDRTAAMAVAAHELRHDLATARQVVEELNGSGIGPLGRQASLIRQLDRALIRLGADIDRLLPALGGSLDTLQKVPTDVGDLIRRVVAAHPTGRHPVHVDAAPVIMNLDAIKIERVVDNLMANAMAHTPDGCPVHVTSRLEPGAITIAVEDGGPGMDAATAAELLTPGDQPPATGIGLWIVARFAHLHGGRVRLEHPPGGGARFVVVLPA